MTTVFSVKWTYCEARMIASFVGRFTELEVWRKAADVIFLAQERLQNI